VQVSLLRQCWSGGDASGVRAAAHRLKGSAANLGAARLAELASVLEELADSRSLGGAGPVLDELEIAAREAALALGAYELVVEAPRSA
jgi:HPt (histidine-containing phosphotransfer) domain-containing protein